MYTRRLQLSALNLIVIGACAGDLRPNDNGHNEIIPLDGEGGPNVRHLDEGDGVSSTRINAASDTEWVYLDLDSGEQLEVSDPYNDLDWDIAFQRFHIKLNGGVSGGGNTDAVVLDDIGFEEIERAPKDDYGSDAPDGDDDDEHPEYVLKEWYDYSITTHILTPAPLVYVVRNSEPHHFRLEFESYYDDAGTSGYPTFRWSRVRGPQ